MKTKLSILLLSFSCATASETLDTASIPTVKPDQYTFSIPSAETIRDIIYDPHYWNDLLGDYPSLSFFMHGEVKYFLTCNWVNKKDHLSDVLKSYNFSESSTHILDPQYWEEASQHFKFITHSSCLSPTTYNNRIVAFYVTDSTLFFESKDPIPGTVMIIGKPLDNTITSFEEDGYTMSTHIRGNYFIKQANKTLTAEDITYVFENPNRILRDEKISLPSAKRIHKILCDPNQKNPLFNFPSSTYFVYDNIRYYLNCNWGDAQDDFSNALKKEQPAEGTTEILFPQFWKDGMKHQDYIMRNYSMLANFNLPKNYEHTLLGLYVSDKSKFINVKGHAPGTVLILGTLVDEDYIHIDPSTYQMVTCIKGNYFLRQALKNLNPEDISYIFKS